MGFFDVWLLPRVWIGAIFCVIGLLLLMKSWVGHNLRLVSLIVIFFAFGVLLILPLGDFARGMSIHPSPVCIVTKPFLFINAGRQVPVVFLSILAFVAAFTIVGNKLFCGWVCPIGAVQETVHLIPLPKRLKVKLPFRISNAIRLMLYVFFLVVIFTAGVSIYDYFNPFEFLFWKFQPLAVQVAIAILVFLVTLIAAVFIFRPFCYLVCPLGLITWILEHLSIVKVKVDKQKCTNCNLCIDMSPCPAVPSILEERKSRPDCHACGRCIEVCPEKALKFRR
jgi:NapH/MauN family ferredoxin-type protein